METSLPSKRALLSFFPSFTNGPTKRFSKLSCSPTAAMIAIASLLTFYSGCRNCNQPPAPQPFLFNQGAVPQTIQPAPTFGLNIPGQQPPQQPYYGGSGTRVGQLPNNGLLDTRRPAPTAANGPGQFNQQQGWRGTDGSDLNTSSNTPSNRTQPQPTSNTGPSRFASSVLTQPPTSLAASSGTSQPLRSIGGPQQNRTVPPGAVANNQSVIRSPDFQTTSVDERLDSSRLAVNDASNVRATTTLVQGQPFPNQNFTNQPLPNQVALANPTIPTGGFQGQFSLPPNVAYQQPALQGSFAQARTLPQPQVVAQATATYDPYGNSTTVAGDWRNRGRDSRQY